MSSGGRSLANQLAGLQFVRSAGDNVAFTRDLEIDPAAPGLILRFNIVVSDVKTAHAPAQVLRLGSGFSSLNVDESNAATFARLGIATTGSGWQVRDLATGVSSAPYHGTQAVTWALNRSGAPLGYAAPDGGTRSLAPYRMDVWVGRTRVLDGARLLVSDAPIGELKWVWLAGAGVTKFDHFDIAELPELAGVALSTAAPPAAELVTEPAAGPSTPSIELYRPSPNPFVKRVTFAYAVASGSQPVEIAVFDLAGRRVRGLVSGFQVAGTHEASWDGMDDRGHHAGNGVYFLRAEIGATTRVLRVVHMDE